MTLIDGTSATVSTTPITLFNITSDTIFACWIFLNPMATSDSFQIKVTVVDSDSGTERLFIDETLSDAQDIPAFYIPYIASHTFKITMTKISGTDRVFKWIRFEQ